jgi:spermidine dehydrogenase
MPGSKAMSTDRALGLGERICRRDFLNSTLLASGSVLLGSLSPAQLLAQKEAAGQNDWDGYGGVGDYANSHGNSWEVMNAAHTIRDGAFDKPPGNAIETGEIFDCVVVGGGISGLCAALYFNKQAPERKCLVLENHPIFGGEAKRNEFIVDGQRLMAQQGSTHFQIPYPHSFIARLYEMIGMDWREFKYQTWGGPGPEIPLSRSPYQMLATMPATYGFYFGARFGKKPGMWLVDPWGKKLEGAPFPAAMRAELLRWREGSRGGGEPLGLPYDYAGDEKSRRLDSITMEENIMAEQRLSRETVREFFTADTAGGFGLGPDVLSAFADYGWSELHPQNDTPETGWHMFPGGNAGIARLIMKTVNADSIEGPRTLGGVCRNQVNFAALDRESAAVRVRLHATVVRVEHEREPEKSGFVWVTYAREGKVYRLKARTVVMAGGGWTTKHIVKDLPSTHREAYAQFYRSPYMVANVALRNWQFLYKLGISGGRWFEGFANWTEVRKVVAWGSDAKTIGPNSPTVLTFYVSYCYPGLPIGEQGTTGRAELLSTSFPEYERKIREQMDEMFSATGFDARRDIAGIILNRWGHAFVNPQPGFFFGKDGKPAPRDVLRSAPFGRIAFSHTELAGAQDHRNAALESYRAVGQLLDQVLA